MNIFKTEWNYYFHSIWALWTLDGSGGKHSRNEVYSYLIKGNTVALNVIFKLMNQIYNKTASSAGEQVLFSTLRRDAARRDHFPWMPMTLENYSRASSKQFCWSSLSAVNFQERWGILLVPELRIYATNCTRMSK